jgi:hypothetical protein
MMQIGMDRLRSKHAASPESGASSGGGMNDDSKQLASIEKVFVELRTKLDSTLPHLATKAELHALQATLIQWIGGALIAGIAAASGVTLVFIRLTER